MRRTRPCSRSCSRAPAAGPPHDRVSRRPRRRCPTASAAARRSTPARCPDGCRACADACPTGAISRRDGAARARPRPLPLLHRLRRRPAPRARSRFTQRLPPRRAHARRPGRCDGDDAAAGARRSTTKLRRLFGRSLKLRQVSAGGCNACEADVNVLGTVVFDLGRFGIQFVASPRHADGLLITGPVTENMRARAARRPTTPCPRRRS